MSATVKRFHVSRSGPMGCTAETIESCPIDGEHFENFEDSQAHFELQMEAEFGATAGLSKADPFGPHSRYGSSASSVPLDLIEPESIEMEEINDTTVLHYIGFSEDSSDEQKATMAQEFGFDMQDNPSIFRLYSTYEELKIGSVIRRQHGIQVNGERYYAPGSMEFVIRTGQDLMSLENSSRDEQTEFENELRSYGLQNLQSDAEAPLETTLAEEDNVKIGGHFKQNVPGRFLKDYTIHDTSHATHYFYTMTVGEKEGYGYSPRTTVRMFADYRSEEGTMNVAMGLDVDGEKFYEAKPGGEPVVSSFEIDSPEKTALYIKNVEQGVTSRFRNDLHANGTSHFMPEHKYNAVFDYPQPELPEEDDDEDFDWHSYAV